MAESLQLKLSVKLIVGREKNGLKHELWSRKLTSLTMLGLPKLTQLQEDTLSTIIEKIWMSEVTIQELEQVVYELFPNGAERELRKTLEVPKFYHTKDFMLVKSFPVKNEKGVERKLILVQETLESGKEWVGVNISTIEKIPFLEALMSDRWNKENSVATISNIRARTLRLVDYVFSSGRDFENYLITAFPLAKFDLRPKEVFMDLDYLSIPFKRNTDIALRDQAKNKPQWKATIENASALVLTLEIFDERTDNRDSLFLKIKHICSNSELYGKNLCQCLEYAYTNISFTKNQKKAIEADIKKSKEAKKWFYDDLAEDIFDPIHDRNLYKEQEMATVSSMRDLGICRNVFNPSLQCTCSDHVRANVHGYVDRTNWEPEWGDFSAGSD